MMSLTNKKYYCLLFLVLFFTYLFVVKYVAIHELDFIGDESNDVVIIYDDYSKAGNFFEKVYEPDQSRLPMFFTAPLTIIFGNNFLIPARILFIIIYTLFLFVFLQTLKLKFSELQSLYFLLLIGLNSYLLSFSIFMMTTSNNLFLLFGITAVYYYIKFFEPSPKNHKFRSLVIFSLFIGLSIASKLFGIFILISLFLYDFFKLPKKIDREEIKENLLRIPLGKTNFLFTSILFLLVFLPIISFGKLIISVFSALVYLSVVMICLYRYRAKELSLSFINKWILIVHTAFNFVVIFSPIYLNFRNISAIFSWYKTWNTPDFLINSSKWDIPFILLFKFGFVAIMLSLFSLFLLYKYDLLKHAIKKSSLFLTIFLVYFAFLMLPKFVLTWYPLFIFPFLYIPISYLVKVLAKIKYTPLYFIIIVILILFPIYEHSRYLRLFPYGHVDGIQYGEKYIGWSKPGFVTFEAIPILSKYLRENKQTLLVGKIGCNLVSGGYNDWGIRVINDYFRTHDLMDYKCSNAQSDNNNYIYYLTTIYTSNDDIKTINKQYKIIFESEINNINIMTLWQRL